VSPQLFYYSGCFAYLLNTGACGKTSLLCTFALGEFPNEYVRNRAPFRADLILKSPYLLASQCVLIDFLPTEEAGRDC